MKREDRKKLRQPEVKYQASREMRKEKRRILLWSFLTPLLLLALGWIGVGFYPFGDRTPLTIDLYHQYAPFLSELHDKLCRGDSLFFSWHSGLGINFYALMSYYLASPLNALMIFFPLEHLTNAVALFTLIKCGLMGLFMALYIDESVFARGRLRCTFPLLLSHERGFEAKRDGFRALAVVGLSSAFAVSAFTLSYCWNIMWLDAIVLLPLLLLGQERILRQRRPFLYIFSLALMLIANYYIAFFNLVFVALYFFVLSGSLLPSKSDLLPVWRRFCVNKALRELPENPDLGEDEREEVRRKTEARAKKARLPFRLTPFAEFLRQGFYFLAANLLGFALAGMMLIPTVLSLRETSAVGDTWPTHHEFRFSFLHFFSRSLIGSSPSIRDGLPNIYIGLLPLLLLPLYFMSKRIRFREKCLHLALLLFLFLSLNSNVLNFAWHGMHYPNQLPHRFAFLYGSLVLLMAARVFVHFEREEREVLAFRIAGAGLIIVALLSEEVLTSEWKSRTPLYLSVVCILFYLAVTRYFKARRVVGSLLAWMFFVIFVGELVMNSLSMIQQVNTNEYYTKRSDFNRDLACVEEMVSRAREDAASLHEKEGLPSFFRMEYMPAKTTNDPALFHYNGFTLFASTSNADVAKIFRKLGYHGNNINSYKYVASTNFLDNLFRIRYLILRDQELSNDRYELIAQTENETQKFKLYRNKDVLPFAFALNSNIDTWLSEDASPFTYQNEFVELGAKGPAIYEHLPMKEVSLENFTGARKDAKLGYSFNAGEAKKKSKISLEVPIEKDMHVYVFVKAVRAVKVDYKCVPKTGSGSPKESGQAAAVASPSASAPGASAAGESRKSLSGQREINKPETFDIGECKKGDLIQLNLEFVDELDNPVIWAAGTDSSRLEAGLRALRACDANLEPTGSREIRGEVSLNESKTIVIPMPYDSGWHIYADDARIESFALAKGFLAFRLPAGTHRIRMEFTPTGFGVGVMISLLGLILSALLWAYKRFLEKPRRSYACLERNDAMRRRAGYYAEILGLSSPAEATGEPVANPGVSGEREGGGMRVPAAAIEGETETPADRSQETSDDKRKESEARAEIGLDTTRPAPNESGADAGASNGVPFELLDEKAAAEKKGGRSGVPREPRRPLPTKVQIEEQTSFGEKALHEQWRERRSPKRAEHPSSTARSSASHSEVERTGNKEVGEAATAEKAENEKS